MDCKPWLYYITDSALQVACNMFLKIATSQCYSFLLGSNPTHTGSQWKMKVLVGICYKHVNPCKFGKSLCFVSSMFLNQQKSEKIRGRE